MSEKPTYEELEKRIRELEEAGTEEMQRFRNALDEVSAHIYMKDPQFRYVYANRLTLELFGCSAEELVGRDDTGFFPPDAVERLREIDLRVLAGEQTSEEIHVSSAGSDRRVYWEVKTPIYSESKGKEIWGLLGISTDITAHKQAEEALLESQRQTEMAVQGADLGTWETNLPSGEKTQNDRYAEMLGYTLDEFGALVDTEEMVHPDDQLRAKEIWEAHANGKTDSYEVECRFRHKAGHWVWVWVKGRIVEYDGDGTPLRLSGTHLDITKRKILEAQLQQSQKMEAIGTLAGGIAHDFNNMLGIILGNTEMATLDVPDWNPARENLNEIKETTLRARDVVKQILAFSRQDEQKLRPIDIGQVLSESLKLIRSTIPTTIDIREDIPRNIGAIVGDPTQINQILLNLCTNAAHAMSDEGGILNVTLEQLHLDEDGPSALPDLTPGNHAKLSISDTGQGILPDDLDRIFDPYFTTKGVGEGTGMGLAVVHGIVKQHKGAIAVNSETGKGTTFDIFFPIIEGESEAEVVIPENIPGGNESILFVDDEPAMSKIYTSMLERLGYTVSFRTSSVEALEAFKAKPDKYDVIITDQTMPHLTGQMLATEIMAIRPDMPVILCTGHSDLIDEDTAKAMGIQAFVMKPIAMGEIARTIREVLD